MDFKLLNSSASVSLYDFNAVPSGTVWDGNHYDYLGNHVMYWASDLIDGDRRITRVINSNHAGLGRMNDDYRSGNSIRC